MCIHVLSHGLLSLFSCSTSKDQFACLVSTPAETLQSINVKINTGAFFGTFTIIPVIDGELIRDRPTKLIQSGKLNGVCLSCHIYETHVLMVVSHNRTHIETSVRNEQPIRRSQLCQPELHYKYYNDRIRQDIVPAYL